MSKCSHSRRKGSFGEGDAATCRNDALKDGIERVASVEVKDGSVQRRPESVAVDDAPTRGSVAVIGKNRDSGGAELIFMQSYAEDVFVECTSPFQVKRGNFEPADRFFHEGIMTG